MGWLFTAEWNCSSNPCDACNVRTNNEPKTIVCSGRKYALAGLASLRWLLSDRHTAVASAVVSANRVSMLDLLQTQGNCAISLFLSVSTQNRMKNTIARSFSP